MRYQSLRVLRANDLVQQVYLVFLRAANRSHVRSHSTTAADLEFVDCAQMQLQLADDGHVPVHLQQEVDQPVKQKQSHSWQKPAPLTATHTSGGLLVFSSEKFIFTRPLPSTTLNAFITA